MRSGSFPIDPLINVANTVFLGVLLFFWVRVAPVGALVATHGAFAVAFWCAAWQQTRNPDGRLVTFVHAWLPVAFIIVTYFELGQVIPQLHFYGDFRFDEALQTVDVAVLGDPATFFGRFASKPVSDVLTICYGSYYFYAATLPALLYRPRDLNAFHHVVVAIVAAFLVCFVGYALVPAVGPHILFDRARPDALEGYGLSRRAYSALLSVPNEPPDCFPSGHALIGMLVPALAWRWHRRAFWFLLPVGVGIFCATLYLRFHYLADVMASVLLVPVLLWVSTALAGPQKTQPRLTRRGA